MGHARLIGRWKMTALVINCIIGSAIFGVPSEGIRLVGNNSPRAMLLGSLLVGIIITAAKVLTLALVIGLVLLQKRLQPHLPAQGLSSSVGAWAQVLLIFIYALSGWEDTLVPSGEVQRPRHTIPFALVAGVLTC